MKKIKYIILLFLVALSMGASAKKAQVPHVYLFGFSASFQDSIVYITDIQDLQGAWMDTKTKFLLGRDNYSYQLSNYLSAQGQPNRVCLVFFSTSKNKAEKKYLKMKKKYTTPPKKKKKNKKKQQSQQQVDTCPYDLRYISTTDFQFTPVDMSE